MVKPYNSYLKYSLGEFTFDKQNAESTPDPIPEVRKYIVWNIKYKDANGNDKSFIINNFYDKNRDAKMGSQVYLQASSICSDEIGENVCSKYFDYIPDEDKVSKECLPPTYIIVKGDYYSKHSNTFYYDCIDDEHGIKLSGINAKKLKERWSGTFKISVITAEIKDEEKLNDILDKTKSLLKDYSKYLNLDSVTACISYSIYDDLYKITYDRKKSNFNVENTREKEADKQGKKKNSVVSENLIDGHVEYIRTYVVNGKKLVWLDNAQYYKETKTYYLGSYINLLKSLGIEVQHVHKQSGDADVRWKIGNDIFDGYLSYTEKILKNNTVIVETKSFFPSNGVTAMEFELISNATVIIDEKKETIIINSNKK